MRFFIVTLVLCFSLKGHAESQEMLGARNALMNFLGFGGKLYDEYEYASSGKTYSVYKSRTIEFEKRQANCIPAGNKAIEVLNQVACQCTTWASCRNELCSCSIMCPENLSIFKRPGTTTEPTAQNTLSFINSSAAFRNYEMSEGFCWGHAAVTQKFNRLAFFKPNQKPMIKGVVLDESKNPQQWRMYYKSVIENIVKNKSLTVPGFANLGEFSKHPVIQEILADCVAKTWAKQAMSFDGLAAGLSTDPMGKDAVKQVVSDLKWRLAHGQSPQFIMTAKGERFYTHVVLVSSVREVQGETRICLNDNNYPLSANTNCQSFLTVTKEGRIAYPKWNQHKDISLAAITPNEGIETIAQMNELVKRCKGDRSCK